MMFLSFLSLLLSALSVAFATSSSSDSPCDSAKPYAGMSCIDHKMPDGNTVPIWLQSNSTLASGKTDSITPEQDGPPGVMMSTAKWTYTGLDPVNTCRYSVYENDVTSESADAHDCEAIRDFARSTNGEWTISLQQLKADPWTIIMISNGCALLAQSPDRPNWSIYIGNVDVGNVTTWAIDHYVSGQGKIEVKGEMGCAAATGSGDLWYPSVYWWMRNSAGIPQ
ncbi:putative necrosis-inducing factor-domain-containing protein [Xylariaceae sp. FL1272]|nr:putative necrosis-inducing factor-domain-containing protein [Xylariaceae sp. FL1272]